jgi:release factor glutamine methyltransferase
MSQGESWTVGRLLSWTTDFLGRRGAETPRLDAEILLAESLGCRRIELYTSYDRQPGEAERTRFRELVKRRSEGTPVAYLVGRREFYSLSFRVSPAVLIPRPETEFVVITLLDLAKQQGADRELSVCDVGTGSGILAICAAKHLAGAKVTAVDISAEALEVARQNAHDHGVADRIEFVASDLLSALPADARFDFIVSTPPYIADSELAAVARDVKEHEPRAALVAGPRGTEVIERLIPAAAERLAPGGHLLIEISPTRHDAVLALVAAEARLEVGPTVKDLARLPRVVHASRRDVPSR